MKKLTEDQIDNIVIAQANDENAWEAPISVETEQPFVLSLAPELAARAAFLARLHNKKSVEEWIESIIDDRIQFEEKVFVELKQIMSHA